MKKTHQQEDGTDCHPAHSPVPAWGEAQHFFHIIAKLGNACGDKWGEWGQQEGVLRTEMRAQQGSTGPSLSAVCALTAWNP